MGINFSTRNYQKIIDILDPPYLENLNFLNNGITDAINLENDKRFMIYKHKSKNIYLFYRGNLCSITNCFDISEQLLLINSKQFDDFYKLKKYITHLYPKSPILNELVKYEDLHDVSMLSCLELGLIDDQTNISIDIDFTDSESSGEYECNNDCIFNINNNINICKNLITENTCNPNCDDFDIIDKDIKDCLDNFESVYNENFDKQINNDWSLNWDNNDTFFSEQLSTIKEVNNEDISASISSYQSLSDSEDEYTNTFKDESDKEENKNNIQVNEEICKEQTEDKNEDIKVEKKINEINIIENRSDQTEKSLLDKIIPNFNYFNL